MLLALTFAAKDQGAVSKVIILGDFRVGRAYGIAFCRITATSDSKFNMRLRFTLVREDVGLLQPLVRLAELFFGTASRHDRLSAETAENIGEALFQQVALFAGDHLALKVQALDSIGDQTSLTVAVFKSIESQEVGTHLRHMSLTRFLVYFVGLLAISTFTITHTSAHTVTVTSAHSYSKSDSCTDVSLGSFVGVLSCFVRQQK